MNSSSVSSNAVVLLVELQAWCVCVCVPECARVCIPQQRRTGRVAEELRLVTKVSLGTSQCVPWICFLFFLFVWGSSSSRENTHTHTGPWQAFRFLKKTTSRNFVISFKCCEGDSETRMMSATPGWKPQPPVSGVDVHGRAASCRPQ